MRRASTITERPPTAAGTCYPDVLLASSRLAGRSPTAECPHHRLLLRATILPAISTLASTLVCHHMRPSTVVRLLSGPVARPAGRTPRGFIQDVVEPGPKPWRASLLRLPGREKGGSRVLFFLCSSSTRAYSSKTTS